MPIIQTKTKTDFYKAKVDAWACFRTIESNGGGHIGSCSENVMKNLAPLNQTQFLIQSKSCRRFPGEVIVNKNDNFGGDIWIGPTYSLNIFVQYYSRSEPRCNYLKSALSTISKLNLKPLESIAFIFPFFEPGISEGVAGIDSEFNTKGKEAIMEFEKESGIECLVFDIEKATSIF